MKNMRYFPLIAFAILCIIAYVLYRTGSFINKTVNATTLSKEDSLVTGGTDPSLLTTTSSTFLDTFPLSSPVSSSAQQQESKSTSPSSTTENHISTSLASPTVADIPPSVTEPTAATKNVIPKAASERRFHVVIGSYKSEANAKAKAIDFEKKNNKKAKVVMQGGYFRVCADEFEFSTSATQYAQKLKEAGNDYIILKF